MSRKRSPENVGLPARWRHVHGAYYYQVPQGLEAFWDGKKLFRLGKTLPEAYRSWSSRLDATDTASTIAQLLERYLLEVVPSKAPKTREANSTAIRQLTKVFGAMPLRAIKPQHIYKYVDQRRLKKTSAAGKVTGGLGIARGEAKVLSHAFSMAVQWGYIDRHPFLKELRLEGTRPRTRYIEDWEVIECLKLPAFRKKGSVLAIQSYIRIKLMTGMARSDLLRLTVADVREDGIHIQRHKTQGTTGKRTHYEMTPDLKAAIEMAKAARPKISPFLFCNDQGKSYFDEGKGTCRGWSSIWQRFMERVIAETKVTEHFTEHDLRAKCASDAPSLEHARALLSHADSKTTNAIYRRKPERVQPLSGI